MYHDTERRLHNDPEFRAIVDMLAAHAIRLGLTPGELKQIAFAAAMKCETLSPREWRNEVERKSEAERAEQIRWMERMIALNGRLPEPWEGIGNAGAEGEKR